MFRPSRVCRKKTGPVRVALDPHGDVGEQRRGQHAGRSRRRRCRSRASAVATSAESRAGGRPTSGRPSTRVHADPGPTSSKSRGTTSICTSSSRQRADERQAIALVGLVREGDDDALDVEQPRRGLQAHPVTPSSVRWSRSIRGSRGSSVDEADEIDSVLRMLEQLASDELADVAGAHDDGVLEVENAAPAECSGDPAGERDEQDSGEREEGELGEGRLGDAEEPERRGDQPQASRRDVEDTNDVVERGVIGTLLIALIKTMEVEEHDPEGNAHGEDQELVPTAEIVQETRSLRQCLCERKRQRQTDDIGDEQSSPYEPAAPPVRQLRPTGLKERTRTVVERANDATFERRREHAVRLPCPCIY